MLSYNTSEESDLDYEVITSSVSNIIGSDRDGYSSSSLSDTRTSLSGVGVSAEEAELHNEASHTSESAGREVDDSTFDFSDSMLLSVLRELGSNLSTSDTSELPGLQPLSNQLSYQFPKALQSGHSRRNSKVDDSLKKSVPVKICSNLIFPFRNPREISREFPGHYPQHLDDIDALRAHPYLKLVRRPMATAEEQSFINESDNIKNEEVDKKHAFVHHGSGNHDESLSRADFKLLDLPEGFLPSIQYYGASGRRISKRLDRELVFLRRNRLVSSRGKAIVVMWNAIDDIYRQILPSTSPASLPFLQLYHPSFPLFDTPPIMLRENATFQTASALDDRWEYLLSVYGQLNQLQSEERILIDKLCYLIGHYQEAIARSDLMTKSIVTSLAKQILIALGALNADDYVVRESLYGSDNVLGDFVRHDQ